MFQVQELEKPFIIDIQCGEYDANCVMSKELKCVCRCGRKNHGAALQKNVKPLDQFSDNDMVEDPVAATFLKRRGRTRNPGMK